MLIGTDVPKRYPSIDAIKGIACIGVIFIHVLFPEPVKMAGKSMARFAVPIFLMTAGFFFTKNGTCTIEATAKKLRHILLLTLNAALFYIIFCVLFNCIQTPGWDVIDFISSKCTAGRIARFFLTNDPFVYSHLWYLLANIYIFFV